MVEGTALEMRHTRKGIVGSNPTLSARPVRVQPIYHPRVRGCKFQLRSLLSANPPDNDAILSSGYPV